MVTRQCARVIMYHRFSSNGAPGRLDVGILERQLRYMRDHFNVIALGDLVSRLRSGLAPEPYSLAVTVDDAYVDFGEAAYPVFLRNQVPVTLYVVSEFASGRIWLWWDAIRHALALAPNGPYELLGPKGLVRVSLSDASSREDAWGVLARLGLNLSPAERDPYLEGLRRSLSVHPSAPPREYAGLDWDALRALDPGIVEIGAHTRTHPILSRCDPERITQEVAGSKKEIERELGREVRAFCYPNGTWADVDERCIAAVREAGYDSAVMACGTLVCKGANVHALDRMGASETWENFVGELSGISHLRREPAR